LAILYASITPIHVLRSTFIANDSDTVCHSPSPPKPPNQTKRGNDPKSTTTIDAAAAAAAILIVIVGACTIIISAQASPHRHNLNCAVIIIFPCWKLCLVRNSSSCESIGRQPEVSALAVDDVMMVDFVEHRRQYALSYSIFL
jgi:hypothetical protein